MQRRLLASAIPSILLLGIPLLFAACVRPPPPLGGTYAEIAMRDAQQGGLTDQRVRWGGTLVTVNPGKEDTCFEILARPLNSEARPRRTDESEGRFMACAPGFYDPAVYVKGRELTVAGTLQEPETQKIGEHEYRYPKVAAEKIYLWPERQAYPPPYYPYWADIWYPGWGPWPYGPWYYQSPFWGPWPYGP